MKHLFSTLVFAALFCLPSSHARAAQQGAPAGVFYFGSQEEVGVIQDVRGTDYKLGHKYTLHFFLAGLYLSDDGYVLQKKGDFNSYSPLSEARIKDLQLAGALPSPLPKYSIPFFQYVIGYSLWIVIAFVAAAPSLQRLMRRMMGKRFCPSCRLELTPHEAETGVCGACSRHL
ncbi:MAG TPA: hypothetical protein VF668_02705 [Pyrinomonadaceae bacterium]|jgi:hypothetical protein